MYFMHYKFILNRPFTTTGSWSAKLNLWCELVKLFSTMNDTNNMKDMEYKVRLKLNYEKLTWHIVNLDSMKDTE